MTSRAPSATVKERVASLEVKVSSMCEAIVELKHNDLQHINAKIDKIDNKVDDLDKKVEAMGIKIGIFVAILSTVGQAVLNYFFK